VEIIATTHGLYVFQTRQYVGVSSCSATGRRKPELAAVRQGGAHENIGIGKKLMTFAEATAKQKGVKTISCLPRAAF